MGLTLLGDDFDGEWSCQAYINEYLNKPRVKDRPEDHVFLHWDHLKHKEAKNCECPNT